LLCELRSFASGASLREFVGMVLSIILFAPCFGGEIDSIRHLEIKREKLGD